MRDQLESTREQTLNQPLKILDPVKVADRSVNRLLKMHEAAQLELRDLEADFQYRLQESILQTEEKLRQRFADEQEQKIKQAEEDIRKATTRELLERFEVDFQKLSGELEERQKNAIAEAENAAQFRIEEVLEEAERAKKDLVADFQCRLQESILQTEEKLTQRFADEQEQKIKQAEEDARKVTTRELLQRFEVDFQKLSSEFEERQKNAIAEVENAAQLRLKEVLEEAERAKEVLEADFQCRLQESILQAEEKLRQRFAGEQEQKIRQTEEDVRKATTRELVERFEADFESAAGKWEIERQQLQHEITKLAELEMKLSEVSHEKARLQEELRVVECQWNTEQNSLRSDMKQSREELLSRFETEMEELKADFEDRRLKMTAVTEAAAELRFAEKIAAANQDFQRREEEIQATAFERFQKTTDEFNAERKEFQRRIAALEEEIACSQKGPQAIRTPLSRELKAKLEEVMDQKARLEEELREANARRNAEDQRLEPTQAARSDTRDVSVAVKAEIARIESRGREISEKIEDPSMDLATQIRFNRERSELEAYLKGLRYSLGEITFDKSEVTRSKTF